MKRRIFLVLTLAVTVSMTLCGVLGSLTGHNSVFFNDESEFPAITDAYNEKVRDGSIPDNE